MRYIVSFLLICAGVGAAVVMYLNKPPTKKSRPPKTAPLVKAVELTKTSVPVIVTAHGTVVPARTLTLQSEVQGRIIYLDKALAQGGLIPANRKLLQVDPEDYRILIKELTAAVTEAKFEVETEKGKGLVAKREWKLLEKEIDISETGKRLVLRLPHQERAAARVLAAESRLEQAVLDEKRTTLTCPFNAMVLDESVEIRQLVSARAELATLVGTDEFWVQVSVPLGRLSRITFEHDGKSGSTAKVILDCAGGESIVRPGRVLRLLGDLNTIGRMARVLIAIDNPLDLQIPEGGGPAKMGDKCILLGCYAKVEIQAGKQEDVYIIPREALREGDRLWLVDKDDKLVFRRAEVLWRRSADVLVRCEVKPGERLITSRLASALNGLKVRPHDPSRKTGSTRPATQPAEGR
jgi:multidrug efflux pump subunit AcrA (membrane-fusion protein)